MSGQNNGSGAADPTNVSNATPPEAGATPPASQASSQNPASPAATPGGELDENGDWISQSSLNEDQKKWMRRVINQNHNRKSELQETKTKLEAKEQAEIAAQRKLDEENGNWKKISDESKAELDKLRERVVRSEIRNEAIKAKMVDLSLLDLLPIQDVQYDKDHKVVGADAFIQKLRTERSYLFEAAQAAPVTPQGTTTTTPPPAPASKIAPIDATKMSATEWEQYQRDKNLR
jgi:hypothetical protein